MFKKCKSSLKKNFFLTRNGKKNSRKINEMRSKPRPVTAYWIFPQARGVILPFFQPRWKNTDIIILYKQNLWPFLLFVIIILNPFCSRLILSRKIIFSFHKGGKKWFSVHVFDLVCRHRRMDVLNMLLRLMGKSNNCKKKYMKREMGGKL